MPSAVVITSRTATDDFNDFDFLTVEGIDSRVFAIAASATCVQSKTHGVGVVSLPLCAGPDAEPLLKVILDQSGQFQLHRPSSARRLWSVVRELPASKHRLSEGDLLRFGRFRFRVAQLVESGEQVQPQFCPERVARCKIQSDCASSVCRICLQEGIEEGNPFCAPCACKGSIADVHVGCLQQWVSGRVQHEDGRFSCSAPCCELCKEALPSHIVEQEGDCARHALLHLPPVEPPFVVLESLDCDKRRSQGTFHVLSLVGDRQAKIGRSEDCQVRIAHCGISRCHATVRHSLGVANEGPGFYLEDNNSKFGTTVSMRKRLPLMPDVPVTVQVGSTILVVTWQSAFDHASLGMVPVHAQAGPHVDSMSEPTSRSDSCNSAQREQEFCYQVSNNH